MKMCLAACRAAFLLGPIALTGCATYSDSFSLIQHDLSARQYDAALQDLEKQANSKTDRALYLLNKGMVLRMKRDFSDSNAALESAKGEIERLYAASVSENALSFIVNDATVSYAGDDYEQVLVHLYMALNYLELGQTGEARVEALQVDIKLREIGEKIPESTFAAGAFSRYLTGLIYEDLGESSDAMIAYRKAYEAYKQYRINYGLPMPDVLKHDLLRFAQQQGLTDEAAQYKKEFDIELQPEQKPDQAQGGELVFILNNGLAPIKREKVIGTLASTTAVVVNTSKNTPPPPVFVKIALPYYESRPNNVQRARINVSGARADTEIMEDTDAIARASLDARMPAITARSMARATAKAALQVSVDRAGNRGGNSNDATAQLMSSIIVRVATAATERADTRSWLTLPSNIQMARLPLPPGSYDVNVELLGAEGQTVTTQQFPGIVITRARKTYLSQHWVPDIPTSRRAQ